MRIAYLECFSGMSGDMFMGALIDAGVPPRVLEEAVEALGVGARLEISRVVRSGISATKVDVWVDGEKDLPREEYRASQTRDVEPPSRAESSTTSTGIITTMSITTTSIRQGLRLRRRGHPRPTSTPTTWPRVERNSRDHRSEPPISDTASKDRDRDL